ncbi:hypothetical protein UFOVP729_7 [uncultured Caudovirales phage]|uniref:Uncharacterized protein n=1 Tax=uncultured Caudovirales phage TaxID=2100421 RepID=A0A6J5NPH0_9CAUD|nr:hypothetical protein UFOVP729_7 [uncultured Caudovirales phage]
MSALSDYSEKLLLDWLMTTGSATRPTAWYVALYTAAPSDSGGGTEVSGNGYSRKSVTFAAASTPGGTTSNTNALEFTASGGSWGTITHVGIFDNSTGGNLLWHGGLTASKVIGDGDTLEFAIGNIDLTVA